MINLTYYELKKLCGQVTIVAIISLIVISTVLNFIFYLDPSNITIKNNGELENGIKSFRTLKNESKHIEGNITQTYLDKLVNNFNYSVDKRKFEDKLGIFYSKYEIPNYLINFSHYSDKMNNFTIGLDFDFLKSEKEFYINYKKSVLNLIKKNNERNWFRYTYDEIDRIEEKVNKIKTPINVQYYKGLGNLIYQYGKQYYLVLIVILFSLSSIFSKDSNNGIDELMLSSTFGRSKSMNSKIIAGNILATIIYSIFLIVQLLIHGLVASLHGWNQSIQNYWHSCVYNITLGEGILIMFFFGLLGVLIVANFVMMLSIKLKYSKLSSFLSLASVLYLIKLTQTSNAKQLQINPIYFSTRLTVSNITDFDFFYFIRGAMIPYSIVIIIISCLYIIVIIYITMREYKKYKLN